MQTKTICKMISLDTGSEKTGWAYWENAVLKESGKITAKGETFTRIADMAMQIINLLNDKSPVIIVIEQSTYVNDLKTFRLLSEIVGIVRGWSIQNHKHHIDYVEYEPNTWRRLVADADEKIPVRRDICKLWDMTKVQTIFNKTVDNDDEADAILIGYARIREMCG